MGISIKNSNVGRPSKRPTKNKIKWAIESTQSMRMASEYLNMSYITFKKYCKEYGLWNPLPSSKGIRKRNSTRISPYDLKKILQGENPSPYRETVLLKKCFKEGYLEQKCSNCPCDFTHITDDTYPLLLDFIDKNHLNTKLENLRVLCLNCIYELQTTMKGWYRHRDVPLVSVIDDHIPRDIHIKNDENVNIQETLKVPLEVEVKEELEVDYIPFEEFQKTLE